MRLQLLNKQIIDEREEGLANKAGAETAGFLFLALTVFSVGSIFTSKVGLSPIMVVALLIASGFYYSVRCQRLGVRFINYSYLICDGNCSSNPCSFLVYLGSKFSIKPGCLSLKSLPFKILTGATYYLFTESSNCMGDEFPCDAPSQSREKTL